MKTFIQTLSPGAKVLTYFIVLWLATLAASIIPQLNDFWFYFIIALVLSATFLHAEGHSLIVLGIMPKRSGNWLQFFAGIAAGCLMLVVTAFITLYLTADRWHINNNINPMHLLVVFIMCFWSAMVQEFVFRGYPFQTLLNKYGVWKTQLLIAVPFGLMHLDHSMNFKTMAMVMFTTGLGSVLFGLAYIKTRNLMLPIGLHLGWNYAQVLIPRTGVAGGDTLISVTSNAQNYNTWVVVVPYVVVVTVAIMILMLLNTGRNGKTVQLA